MTTMGTHLTTSLAIETARPMQFRCGLLTFTLLLSIFSFRVSIARHGFVSFIYDPPHSLFKEEDPDPWLAPTIKDSIVEKSQSALTYL